MNISVSLGSDGIEVIYGTRRATVAGFGPGLVRAFGARHIPARSAGGPAFGPRRSGRQPAFGPGAPPATGLWAEALRQVTRLSYFCGERGQFPVLGPA